MTSILASPNSSPLKVVSRIAVHCIATQLCASPLHAAQRFFLEFLEMGAIAVCSLESASPYSPSFRHETEKKVKEQPDAYEERTWRNVSFLRPWRQP